MIIINLSEIEIVVEEQDPTDFNTRKRRCLDNGTLQAVLAVLDVNVSKQCFKLFMLLPNIICLS